MGGCPGLAQGPAHANAGQTGASKAVPQQCDRAFETVFPYQSRQIMTAHPDHAVGPIGVTQDGFRRDDTVQSACHA
jgi:hypothetical protein